MFRYLAPLCCCLWFGASLSAASPQSLERLLAEGRFEAAANDGRALLQQRPEHLQTRFLTAYALQMSGRQEAAVALYEGLIEDYPKLPEPRNNLAMIYLDRGDYDRASRLLVDAIHTHPSYATAYDNLSRIYKGIASEAYRRAVSESAEPSKFDHDFELAALPSLATVEARQAGQTAEEPSPAVTMAELENRLVERVRRWAEAWSGKEFERYVDFYSADFSGRFDTHGAWQDSRRERILRPGEIRVAVEDFKFRWVSENLAIIDFRQAFDSPTYSDRVIKRLAFSRGDAQWKITDERVLSVL